MLKKTFGRLLTSQSHALLNTAAPARTCLLGRALFSSSFSRPSAFSAPPAASLLLLRASRAFASVSAVEEEVPPALQPFERPVRVLALHDLADNQGALKKAKRVGRGPGSNLGKTCGKGHKGTYQRHRLHKRGFEGNQAPLWKVTPKRGRVSNAKGFARPLNVINLDRIQMWINKGRLNPAETITMRHLRDSGIMGNAKVPHGVKLLARGKEKLKTACNFEVTHASEEVVQAVKAVGGSVKFVWFAKIPLRAHLKPHKFALPPRSNGIPPAKYWKRYGLQLEEQPRREQDATAE